MVTAERDRDRTETRVTAEETRVALTVTTTETDHSAHMEKEVAEVTVIRDLTRITDRVQMAVRVIETAEKAIRIAVKNLVADSTVNSIVSTKKRLQHRMNCVAKSPESVTKTATRMQNSATIMMHLAARSRRDLSTLIRTVAKRHHSSHSRNRKRM